MKLSDLQDPEYLGDGVYLGHDSFQLWLVTERELGWDCIALEPGMVDQIEAYMKRIWERAR